MADPHASRAAQALDGLKGLHPRVIDLSLDRMHRLLAALGHPERRLPPVLHVAGTNGKGSTLAFARAMLEAAGHRVHAFTSPHLVRVHECVRLGAPGGGRLVADAVLAEALEECARANAGQPVTPFEALTAAALLCFARTPADAVLIEVGMGGRDDATNVVDRPAAAAITRISHDHHEFLGHGLDDIARAKAGIAKPGRPLVVGPQDDPAVSAVLAETAARLGAPLHAAGRDWTVAVRDDGFTYASARRTLRLPPPALPGAHQMVNAATAIACLDVMPDLAVDDGAIRRGLAAVDWPGRLQRLDDTPLLTRLPYGSELWLDGGHNDTAGAVLAAQAQAWAADGRDLPLVLVAGMLASKDARAFLAPLAPWVGAMRTVPMPLQAPGPGLEPDQLAAVARGLGIADAGPAAGVDAALAGIGRAAGGPRGAPVRALITGSLYLIGAVLGSLTEGAMQT
ncbi:MAG TPA: folylpolyglutamate synthase/dihydrofolate synthase family protein [Azospirillum sp.]|nr:folylpolyglutamate synthase/dihydrofolate synthase family protein [Azospirillum sp.]